MSKFLGPVHFWLYRKIQFQESLIDALISYAVQEGWNDEDLTAANSMKSSMKQTSMDGCRHASRMQKNGMPLSSCTL